MNVKRHYDSPEQAKAEGQLMVDPVPLYFPSPEPSARDNDEGDPLVGPTDAHAQSVRDNPSPVSPSDQG